jgi:predicted aspartyl protease
MTRFFGVVAVTSLVAGLAWLPATANACEPLAPGASSVAGATGNDSAGRAVALIHINGQGPFRFIIDTGANRSVISQALATRLGLAHSGEGMVHSIDGAELAKLVTVDSLSFGALQLSSGETPVLDGPMLAGEPGLLGVDGMAGRLLHVDFTKHCVEIYEDAAQISLRGWLNVPARVRFGTLIMVRGDIVGVPVNVLIDTGSDISIANERFREALRGVAARTIERHGDYAFTFGRPIVLEKIVWTPRLRIGAAVVDSVKAYIGDFHIFDHWGLQDEPTLLIGMDVLARSREMAIDYEHAVVHFRKRPRGDPRGGRLGVDGVAEVAAAGNERPAPGR